MHPDLRRRLLFVAAPAVALLAVPAVLDGGPPGGGAAPLLQGWQLTSADSAAPGGGLLCDSSTPCSIERVRAAVDRRALCAWSGTLWLATWDAPLVLRDVSGVAHYHVEASARGVRDGEDAHRVFATAHPVQWHEGAWWRAFAARVTVTTAVPCDVETVGVALNLEGRTPLGERVTLASQLATARVEHAFTHEETGS